jgi:hypothetical protein
MEDLWRNSGCAQIKKALGISGILTEQSAWQHRTSTRHKSGTQIDLLIDRPDGVSAAALFEP